MAAVEGTGALAVAVAVAAAVALVVAEITELAAVVATEEVAVAVEVMDLKEALPMAMLHLLMAEAAMEEATVVEVEAALRAGGKVSHDTPIIFKPLLFFLCTLSSRPCPASLTFAQPETENLKTSKKADQFHSSPLTTRTPTDSYIRTVIVVDELHYLSRLGP